MSVPTATVNFSIADKPASESSAPLIYIAGRHLTTAHGKNLMKPSFFLHASLARCLNSGKALAKRIERVSMSHRYDFCNLTMKGAGI